MKQSVDWAMYYGASPKLFEYAKAMRVAPTEAEAIVWEVLNAPPFKQYRFRRQHPIANYIADFYSNPLKLVIEVDGGIHLNPDVKQYDIFRDEDMQQLGITVLRFTNDEVMNAPLEVKERIEKVIAEILLARTH